MKKPFVRIKKNACVPALLLISGLLLFCGVRLAGERGKNAEAFTEAFEAFADENAPAATPQSLFALLRSVF